ncbi:MAG: hypothetical protein JXP73_05855 [Deltaproteobacteria bacterium]|nr:hypothetical protein [Deltaproteobacteria bacterium]
MRKSSPHLLLLAATCAMAGLSSRRAGAVPNLDPFAERGPATLSPFHTAQAEEEPLASPRPAQRGEVAEHSEAGEGLPSVSGPKDASHRPEVETATKPAVPRCARDEECPAGTICENGTCQAFERPIDILLYRKAGRSTQVLPLYFSNRGNPGHRVLAPFYFHFWSPESRTRIVAPFYWRVEDHVKQRVVTVVGLYAQTAQPDAKSWAVWPFFYLSTKFGWAAPPLLSFKVGNPDRGKAFGLWFLLYFWSRSAESKFDLLFPFAISRRSQESSFTWVAPLNFHWRNRDDRSLLSIPFFYRNLKSDGGAFASWLGYASVEGQATAGSYLWLYWYGRSKASSYDVVFPLLWSFRSPKSDTTILPPLFHFRRGDTTVGTFALLGWWYKNERSKSSWQLAPPLYFHKSSDDGAKALHLWPFGAYARDEKAGSRRLTLLVPPVLYWRDKDRETDFELLYYRHHDRPAGTRTTVLGPYYKRDDPAGSTRAVFPLFWYFRDAATGATAHSLLPFYFRRNSPHEKLTAGGIFPLWGYSRRFADGGSSAGLFPLAFFGSRKDRSHAIVFPLFWRFRKADAVSTLFFPFFYAAADKTTATTSIFPLLYFSGRDGQDHYRIQVPFYFHVTDGRAGTSTTVAPLYFRHEDRRGYAAGVPPLVFWGGGRQRHFAFFPLLWWFRDDDKDRTTTVVANYLHRRHGGETTDAFFPLFHYRRGAKPGGTDETSLTLFPLFHYRRDAQAAVFASPLAIWSHTPTRQAGFFGPYFWYRDEAIAARGVPLLFLDHTQLDTGERTRMWGPFVALDGPDHRARVLFPLWANYRNQKEDGTYVFPTFFRLRKTDGYRLNTLFPLLWLSRSPTSHTTQILTYFSHHSPTGASTGLLPFYLSTRGKKRDLLLTPLFLATKNHEKQSSRIVSWLYYESRERDRMFRTVFPLWWQTSDQNQDMAIGFPLYWHFADKQKGSSMSLAGPLYWAKNGSERTRGLLPLAWYSRDEQNRSASHAVLPLFYERHSPRSRTVLSLPFGYHRKPDRHWWYAGPLCFYHRNHATETRTLVIPPLLHYSCTGPDRSLSSWFLLFWHKRNVTSSDTYGLPLVYDFHAYHRSRLTMVLPLFFRYKNEVSGQTTTLAPLYFRRSGPTDSTTIAFPLLWRFWSPERSTTVVFPFYVGVRRPTHTSSYVFPNVYYRKGLGAEAGTSHLFVFPFWESQVKRPGDYMWEALLGLVGWERIGRNRFLKLLFIPFELEAAPAAKTAWYGKPPARRRERLARGLDLRSW